MQLVPEVTFLTVGPLSPGWGVCLYITPDTGNEELLFRHGSMLEVELPPDGAHVKSPIASAAPEVQEWASMLPMQLQYVLQLRGGGGGGGGGGAIAIRVGRTRLTRCASRL